MRKFELISLHQMGHVRLLTAPLAKKSHILCKV